MAGIKNLLARYVKSNRFLFVFYLTFVSVTVITSITGNTQISSFICDKTSDLFLRLINLLSLPIVFLSITTTISKLNSLSERKKVFSRILSYTLLTTIIAAGVGLVMFFITFGDSLPVPTPDVKTESGRQMSFSEFAHHLETLIPKSIFEPFIHGNIISVSLLALIFGMSGIVLPKKEKRIFNEFLATSYMVLINIVRYFTPFMPLVAFSFLYSLFNDSFPLSSEKGVVFYITAVIGSNLIQAFLVLPAILAYHKIPIIKSIKGIFPALTFAFFSKSTSATLPLSLQCAEEKMGIKSYIARFSFPICTMINMNGCAAFILITSLYVLADSGTSLALYDYAIMLFIAVLASIGNAGVPMGCFFMTTAILTSMGANLELLGVIFPFYMLLDMLESVINLWSDTCVTLVIDKKESPVQNSARKPSTPLP